MSTLPLVERLDGLLSYYACRVRSGDPSRAAFALSVWNEASGFFPPDMIRTDKQTLSVIGQEAGARLRDEDDLPIEAGVCHDVLGHIVSLLTSDEIVTLLSLDFQWFGLPGTEQMTSRVRQIVMCHLPAHTPH